MDIENIAYANGIKAEIEYAKKVLANWQSSVAVIAMVGAGQYNWRVNLSHECISFEELQQIAVVNLNLRISELEKKAAAL